MNRLRPHPHRHLGLHRVLDLDRHLAAFQVHLEDRSVVDLAGDERAADLRPMGASQIYRNPPGEGRPGGLR